MELGREEVVTEVDGDLEISYVRLASPLPPDFPRHPEGCDGLGYLRYRLASGPVAAADADAICIVQPGTWGGAYSLDRLARNTVRMAAAKDRTIEWWSIGRRGCGAWDFTGIEAAKRAENAQVAVDYYYGGAEVDGRRFEGFKQNRDLRFTAELGLAQTVTDQHEITVRELPDPDVRRRKVFLGGHSLGGLLVAMYLAWDFDGVAGHDQCAGLIAIDTLIDPDPVGIQRREWLRRPAGLVFGHLHHRLFQFARLGIAPRTMARLPMLSPESTNLLALAGLFALYHPDEEVDLFRQLPPTRAWEIALRFFSARTWRQFLTGRPSVRDVRVTGEATLGGFFDDGISPIDALSASIGTLDGPVAEKRFPFPPWFRRVPGVGRAAAALSDIGNLVAPTDPNHLYRWRNYDEVDDAHRAAKVVDIQDLARQLVGGPLGFLEGYFPMRLHYDTQTALAGARDRELSSIKHVEGAQAKPIVHVLADRKSLVPAMLEMTGLLPADATVCPGYRHIDMVCGAWIQNDGKPEPVSDAISDFLVTQTVSAAPSRVGAGRNGSRRRARSTA